MKLFGSKTSAPDLPSNQLPCPVFPPIPQMDPLSHQVLGFQPTVCFAKSVGCAWSIDGTCAAYVIARHLLAGLPAPSGDVQDGSKPGETPASAQVSSQGNA